MKEVDWDKIELKGPATPKQKSLIMKMFEKRNLDSRDINEIEEELDLPSTKENIYPDDWVNGLSKADASKVIGYLLNKSD